MARKLSKPASTDLDLTPHGTRSTAISPWATLAWGRIPSHTKAEIIAAVEQASPPDDANTKIINVDNKVLKVRQIASGFRVIYESGDGGNTIVSVLTPREAGLARD